MITARQQSAVFPRRDAEHRPSLERRAEIYPAGEDPEGVPDYVSISLRWFLLWEKSGSNDHRMMFLHYRQVAAELGQCLRVEVGPWEA